MWGRAAAQEKLESSEAQVRELSERLAAVFRSRTRAQCANGAGSAVAAGLLVRHRARAVCLPEGDRAPRKGGVRFVAGKQEPHSRAVGVLVHSARRIVTLHLHAHNYCWERR